jgi:hypothetical protein
MDATTSDANLKLSSLLNPPWVFTAAQVLSRPSPVPKQPGTYAWYFDEIPPSVPSEGCHQVLSHTLLYVGIAPKGVAAKWQEGQHHEPPSAGQIPP